MEEKYDLVVVGGGVHGLPVLKTYNEVNPHARVLLLDAGLSIGGTWSSERLYQGLVTNNQVGSFEYPDFPMDFETFGVKPGSHVPGEVVHKYLDAYVDHFSLRDKIKLGATVTSSELLDDGAWLIRFKWQQIPGSLKDVALVTRKLVMGTGTTATPRMPSIPGMEKFKGPLFHTIELVTRTEDLEAAKNIVVLGGSKSSADAVYMNASQGRHVDWIIRASGNGPGWLVSPYVSSTSLLFERLATIRGMSFVSPALDPDDYPVIRAFLHRTWLGRFLLRSFFALIYEDMTATGHYNEHPETKKLLPSSSFHWWGTTVGVFNYPTDLFKLIRQGLVSVHIADPVSISEHAVQIDSGAQITADVLICATGYEHTPTVTFLPENVADKVGVSTAPPDKNLVQAADDEVMRRFPGLKDQPPGGPNGLQERGKASYALYRGVVPPSFLASRNLAYCGTVLSLKSFLTAHILALWITAFLDDRLSAPLPSEADAEWQALLQNRFWRWRSPNGFGASLPDMVLETMPFLDTLLRELGLPTARKSSWWREMFEFYSGADYPQIVQEWLCKEKLISNPHDSL